MGTPKSSRRALPARLLPLARALGVATHVTMVGTVGMIYDPSLHEASAPVRVRCARVAQVYEAACEELVKVAAATLERRRKQVRTAEVAEKTAAEMAEKARHDAAALDAALRALGVPTTPAGTEGSAT